MKLDLPPGAGLELEEADRLCSPRFRVRPFLRPVVVVVVRDEDECRTTTI
jgi:hypothetical protein